MSTNGQQHNFDFLVIGSGIAGLTFALKAAKAGSVALITKKHRAESNTNYAQGGIAAVMAADDSLELHVRDTLECGAGLCKEDVVRTIVSEGPALVRELIKLGVKFTEQENGGGQYDLGREGGHSRRRVLHAGDLTGREVEHALLTAAAREKNITLFEERLAIDLITTHRISGSGANRCLGTYVLDEKRNTVEVFAAKITLLATGGAGKVYLYTSNPDIASGDGVAMAYRAGASVASAWGPCSIMLPNKFAVSRSVAVRIENRIAERRITRKSPPTTATLGPGN